MQIPIFWRLISGYALILLLSLGVSSYSIVQLGRLSGTARAALDTDNRMIDYQEKITDAFLSEVRYAGRFIITHTTSLHDQFRQFRNDFVGYMREIKSLAASADIKARISRVEELHLRYEALFDREVRYIKAGQLYAESRYQQEKEKALESALREMERLKKQLQNNLNNKLETMDTAARTARTGAALATLLLLGLGVALSLAISKSITRPLAKLKRITEEETERASSSRSEVYRIPEIRELSAVLSTARRKLREAAETNAAFVETITEQFAMPLISLKKRLGYLEAKLNETASAEQRATFQILTKETEVLIQRCAQVQPRETHLVEAPKLKEQTSAARVEQSPPCRNMSWKRHWGGFYARMEAIAGRGASLVTGQWHTISHSIRTLASGKTKKQ